MKKLHTALIVALAALGIAASAHADYATGSGKGGPGMGPEACPEHGGWHKPDPERMAKFLDKRLADMHAKLKLTAQQEPAWKAFTDKIKPVAPTDHPDFAALSKLPTPERLDRMQAFAKEHQDRRAAHAVAVKAFYGTLTTEQQKTFDANFMQPGGEGPRHRDHEGRRGGRYDGPQDGKGRQETR